MGIKLAIATIQQLWAELDRGWQAVLFGLSILIITLFGIPIPW